jgi:hypothetical protein
MARAALVPKMQLERVAVMAIIIDLSNAIQMLRFECEKRAPYHLNVNPNHFPQYLSALKLSPTMMKIGRYRKRRTRTKTMIANFECFMPCLLKACGP